MGCVKLHILDQQYKNTELKVSYTNKELTSKNSVVNLRRRTLVNRIDPDGRDWYYDKDDTRQFNPVLNKYYQVRVLQEGQTYISATDIVKNKKGRVIEEYRKDGSIMYANESSGYARVWNNSKKQVMKRWG
ncbi:hypothetical protein [Bacteroides reticulotermitis]|uniref:Uncharacterized protein n=1 Tax=Bacteroides reticulotermitis TaxID=1133319 RepID=A0A840D173_9BACE|nr:hypothetical protein [Bacteroides reticulotermitis]MBB4045356.1 hypothetical protein [Bacteroides reticulotermitis]